MWHTRYGIRIAASLGVEQNLVPGLWHTRYGIRIAFSLGVEPNLGPGCG